MYLDSWIVWTLLIIVCSLLVIVMFFSFRSIYKSEKVLIRMGERDEFIRKEYGRVQTMFERVFGTAMSVVLIAVSFCVCAISIYAIILKDGGNIVYLFGRGRLVIVSDSMSNIAEENDYFGQLVSNGGYLTDEMISHQFARGDILYFTECPSEEDLIDKDENGLPCYVDNGDKFRTSIASKYLNKVFAFKFNGAIFVHRLVHISASSTSDGKTIYFYTFIGDLYPTQSQVVTYEKLQGVATDTIVRKLGYPILFLSSTFGIYCILMTIFIVVASNTTVKKIDKRYRERYLEIISGRACDLNSGQTSIVTVKELISHCRRDKKCRIFRFNFLQIKNSDIKNLSQELLNKYKNKIFYSTDKSIITYKCECIIQMRKPILKKQKKSKKSNKFQRESLVKLENSNQIFGTNQTAVETQAESQVEATENKVEAPNATENKVEAPKEKTKKTTGASKPKTTTKKTQTGAKKSSKPKIVKKPKQE